MITFIPCRLCATKPGPVPGYYYDTQDGYTIIKECSCKTAWRTDVKLTERAKKANIWYTDEAKRYNPAVDYVGEKSRASVQALQNYVDNIPDVPACLSSIVYMYGPYGTQKTYLAQWLGLSLLKKNLSVQYVMMNTLMKILSDDLPSPEKEAQIQKLKTLDVLIIDESFQKGKMTIYKSGYQLPFIEIFIRERVDQYNKGIIFISNVLPSGIQDSGMSASLQDFVQRHVTNAGSLLTFEDNFTQQRSSFTPSLDIFKKRS